jgi:hypothetical protein
MIDLRRFLRLLDVALAEGPTRAPEEMVATVVAAVRVAPRERASVEFARRGLTELAFAGIAVAVLVGTVLVSR